jgi:hypothetical protein
MERLADSNAQRIQDENNRQRRPPPSVVADRVRVQSGYLAGGTRSCSKTRLRLLYNEAEGW